MSPFFIFAALLGLAAWALFVIYFLMQVRLRNHKILCYFFRLIPVTLVSVKNIKDAYVLTKGTFSLSLFLRTGFFINSIFSPIVIIEPKKGLFRLGISSRHPEDLIRRLNEERNQFQISAE